MKFEFEKKHTLEERKTEANRIIMKYPERIPVICEKENGLYGIPDIEKSKYLVPCDLTMGQFMYVIRKRLKLSSEQAIFLFINGSIPSATSIICDVYEKNRNEDRFLYISYSGENTFGKKNL
jgi:GABA(A) receptor-associated protein